MNFSTLSGIVFGMGLIYWAIQSEMENASIFFNLHGISIVVGGTFAAALICFSFRQILNIFKVLVREIFGSHQKVRNEVINEIVELSKINLETDISEQDVEGISNDFLKESLNLFMQGGLADDELEEILDKRVQMQNERYQKEGVAFRTIGKFPPAFGLIGATMGMIALLQGLGAPNAFEQLGPSMSVALTATFWGLVLANLLLVPLGENLTLSSDEDLIVRRIAVDGVLLLREKKHPLLVEEYLVSYLSPLERKKLVVS